MRDSRDGNPKEIEEWEHSRRLREGIAIGLVIGAVTMGVFLDRNGWLVVVFLVAAALVAMGPPARPK
jgi:hypothetical protein